jgi:signal transduction histidine kinase
MIRVNDCQATLQQFATETGPRLRVLCARVGRSTATGADGRVVPKEASTSSDHAAFSAVRLWRGSLSLACSVRYVATVVVIAGGYYAFTELGKSLLLTGPAGAFWPSAGLGIAVLYLGGLRWWPAILLGDLGSLLGDVIALAVPPGTALAEAGGDLARTVVSVAILRRLAGPRIAMNRIEQVGAVLVAVVAGGAISATVAMLALQAGDVIKASEMSVFWRSWWLGDVSGGLVVLPLALAWAQPQAPLFQRRLMWRRQAARALVGRRVAWEGALVIAAVGGLSVAALSAGQPLTYLVFPALIWGALRLGSRGATVAVAVAVLIAVSVTSNQVGPFVEHSPNDSALSLQLYIVVATLTTLCLAVVVSERRRAALELAASRGRIVAAGDAERRRIERDLHDGAQQRLVALRVRLGLADDLIERDPADAQQKIGKLQAEIDDVLDDVKSLAAGIYPSVLAGSGLAEAVRTLAQQSPIAASVEIQGAARCRPEVESAVYFCCSEALQNATKHASGATTVVISLTRNSEMRFEIQDNGFGFSPRHVRSGQGLENMRERMESVGGTVRIISTPTKGTRIVGTIPHP